MMLDTYRKITINIHPSTVLYLLSMYPAQVVSFKETKVFKNRGKKTFGYIL